MQNEINNKLRAFKYKIDCARLAIGDKNLDLNALKVLQTGAPYVCDKLHQLKTQIWNEALTYLGVCSVQYQKKERINTEEINRSMGGAFASRRSRITARQNAVEEINKMFGLSIEVDFEDEVDKLDNNGYNINEGVEE